MTGNRFWDIQTISEGRVIRNVIKRRFPRTYAIIAESLESADPLDVVYPDNPDEYSDVVLEVMALLAPVGGRLDALSVDDIERIIREGIARCFGEEPDEARLARAVQSIRERSVSD
ncbi:hypothetical protein [Actinoallomurus acaciae]|uniref:Uncharacterized protein n=1 Tax=Actinoallomurus acaciae TaxID=502577 RepID=A0ABV5YA46_9ACTN